ncbi:hypothetical protein KR059_011011 [Drosophila kikkawai]|nr:hypothetical protein KR059_011011 [Drosophila kikkawai]
MSCLSLMKISYTDRCEMARKLPHCNRYTNIINYFQLMYCDFRVRNNKNEIYMMGLYSLIYMLLLCVVFLSINEYYLPALKIAAIRCRLNEYLAGVILVGVANSTNDVLLSLSPVRAGSPTLNIAMSTALTSICLSGGAICFIMPFKMSGSNVFRDFLFVIFLLELIRLFLDITALTNWMKAAVILSIYPIYLAVNIFDFILTRHNIRSKNEPNSPQMEKKMYDKVITLTDLEVDDDVQLLRMKTRYGIFRAGVYVTPKPLVEPKQVNAVSNRKVLHSINNPRNRFLFTEFFQELNPIDKDQWSLSGKFGRLKIILTAPVSFILRLAIPKVNYAQIKHGWSKLLNCLQIVINPFWVLMLLETMFGSTHGTSWLITFNYEYAYWSLAVTVPLSLIVFCHSRTDIPPPYHIVFAAANIISVITVVWVCAWEMEVIVSIIGIVFHLSPNYMIVTFNALSNALPDMITYTRLSKNGFGKMAFGGIIGGIVFDLVSNIGTQFAQRKLDHSDMFGDFGETLYVFLLLAIWTTISWCWIFDFHARRSGGVFLWCLFGIFLIYVTFIELNLIHDFTEDMVIRMKS